MKRPLLIPGFLLYVALVGFALYLAYRLFGEAVVRLFVGFDPLSPLLRVVGVLVAIAVLSWGWVALVRHVNESDTEGTALAGTRERGTGGAVSRARNRRGPKGNWPLVLGTILLSIAGMALLFLMYVSMILTPGLGPGGFAETNVQSHPLVLIWFGTGIAFLAVGLCRLWRS